MLEVVKDHFDLPPLRMFREVNAAFNSLLDILKLKAIAIYRRLASSDFFEVTPALPPAGLP